MFRMGLEMFRFPVVKSSLRFPNVKIVAVPATSFVDESVLEWDEGFDVPGLLKNTTQK